MPGRTNVEEGVVLAGAGRAPCHTRDLARKRTWPDRAQDLEAVFILSITHSQPTITCACSNSLFAFVLTVLHALQSLLLGSITQRRWGANYRVSSTLQIPPWAPAHPTSRSSMVPGWKGGKALPFGGSFGEYSLNDLEEQPGEREGRGHGSVRALCKERHPAAAAARRRMKRRKRRRRMRTRRRMQDQSSLHQHSPIPPLPSSASP